jgi:large conductance mechanosensitive channel
MRGRTGLTGPAPRALAGRSLEPAISSIHRKGVGPVLKEFKEFALKGNVLDMAVGIIIGAAFGKVVSSLVENVIMPPIGLLLGRVDFANLYINLSGQQWKSLDDAIKAGAPLIRYGVFLNQAIGFLIVAFAVFLMVKAVNRLRKQDETVEEATEKACPYCQTDIPLAATRCPNCTSQLGEV